MFFVLAEKNGREYSCCAAESYDFALLLIFFFFCCFDFSFFFSIEGGKLYFDFFLGSRRCC